MKLPLSLFTSATAVLLLSSCHKSSEPAAQAKLPTVATAVSEVKSQPLLLTEEITATVRSRTRAVLEARVPGRLLKVDAVLGAKVEAGAVLAELDAAEILTKLDQAKATLDQAARDEKRLGSLLSSGASTRVDYDAAKARLDVSSAAVREAETMLSYTKVTAPFTGVITRKLADTGDLAAPGRPLLEMEDPLQLRVEADVPESLIATIKLGDSLKVSQPPNAPVLAKLAEIAPAADSNTRTFPVKLDLPAESTWRAGQFVRLAIPVREIQSLFVPATAILHRGQIDALFVAENSIAKLRLVRLGSTDPSKGVQILSGLDSGETIVIDHANALRDGQPISSK